MEEIRVQSLGQEDPLEEEMATHSYQGPAPVGSRVIRRGDGVGEEKLICLEIYREIRKK